MNATPAEIRLLEKISGRAWPPREKTGGRGWEARYADGMHRRVNSATVWSEASGLLPGLVDVVEAWYRQRAARTTFILTDASAPGLDGLLAGRGFRVDAPTQVWTRSLPLEGPASGGVEITREPVPAWLAAFTGTLGYGDRRRRLLRAQLSRIVPPTGYGRLPTEAGTGAVGLAVADGDHVGIFEVVTVPEYRGRGLAAVLVGALLAWGSAQGAVVGYLQVMEDNPPAMRIYRRLGFEAHYRYWYRIGETTAPSSPADAG